MARHYRALLIGNSTYPTDEHNLQTLKGPIKDIAALNRALVDPDTGLFADLDVTLLPEATSARAVRALGRFFASAERDDVLLMYFSGHGKLDQLGRLHLCMQDTETTDLLSTAVSSVRVSEFADASRAKSIVIILDCCYAGAFRGADLGAAVAGPGRYVMSSCRGSQLANDATVDNGTSFFTQHLVEGLREATDQDDDGYISFSDLYTYVDRRLRDDGKQIPQRRVDADGDLALARRRQSAPVPVAAADPTAAPAVVVPDVPGAPPPAAPPPPTARAASTPPAPAPARRRWTRRRNLIAVAVGTVVAAAIVAALLLRSTGDSAHPGTPGSGSYTAPAPWRIRVDGTGYGHGCLLTLTDTKSGETVPLPLPDGGLFSVGQYQVPSSGSFRWTTSDRGCLVTPFAGTGTAVLPFTQELHGDTNAFPAPPRGVDVRVKNNTSSECNLALFDATNGQELDIAKWSPGTDAVTLNPNGRRSVYVFDDDCVIAVSAHP
jgi:Caspase domain